MLAEQKRRQRFVQELGNPGEIRRVAIFQSQLESSTSRLARLNAWVEAQQALGLLEDSVQKPLQPEALDLQVPETAPRISEEKNP